MENKKGQRSKKRAKESVQVTIESLLQEMPVSSQYRVHSYWNTLSIDMKKEFLMIRVEELKLHFESPDTDLDEGSIGSVVSVTKAGKSWKAWICFPCDEGFFDSESYIQHLEQKHVGNLSPEMEIFLPHIVDNEWIENIHSCSWKPLDASAAIKMVENQAKSEEASIIEEAYSLADGWPLSNDSERAKLLERIQGGFNTLIRHKYLAASHLSHVINLARDEISKLAAGSQILNHALDQSPNCICFLGTPELSKIFKFLLELIHACHLVINADKSNDPIDDLHNLNQIFEIKDEIVLSEDGSCLLLDQCLVPAPNATESAALDDVINNTDPFLSWIFSGSCLDQWDLWHIIKEDNESQTLKLVQVLKKEFDLLKKYCEEKCELTVYDKALKVVEDLCLEEGKKRENFTESVQQSYEYVLIMRKEELSKSKEHVSNPFELDVITNVLEKAQLIKVNQSGYEKKYTGACDLESQMDSYIKTAIDQLKGNRSEKLSKIDGVIMRSVVEVERLELKLKRLAGFNFHAMLLPLVKSYLKARLDDLAKKDAKQKAEKDANEKADALLAELDAESKKGVKWGSDSPKPKEKTRNIKGKGTQANLEKQDEENPDPLESEPSKEKATYGDEQRVLDTTTSDYSSAAPDKKKLLAERLIEIETKKKSIAEQEKELEEEEELFNIEMEEKKEKLAEKHMHLAHQQRELEEDEERIKIELGKQDDEDQDPIE